MTATIEFKPRTVSLTVLRIDSADLQSLRQALAAKLASVPQGFFTGMLMAADISQLPDADADWARTLKRTFTENGLTLIGLIGANLSADELAALGLTPIPPADSRAKPAEKAAPKPAAKPAASKPAEKSMEQPAPQEPAQPEIPALQATTAGSRIIHGNIRGGQREYAQGDLIVIGTVSAGAEIIAGGNIHVLGTLRGRAFAGVQGDESTHIFASIFDAELISIAGSYQTQEQLEKYRKGGNLIITLNKDETMRFDTV